MYTFQMDISESYLSNVNEENKNYSQLSLRLNSDHDPPLSDMQNQDIKEPEDQVDSDTEEEVENAERNNKEVDEITRNQMIRRRFRYPERPGVRDCSYYLRTGWCRFGMSCKFNHPVPREIQVSFGFCDTLFQPDWVMLCEIYIIFLRG